MIEAGAESTSSTINSCFKYLAANPRVQACAHSELDRIMGCSRSPTFADRPNLPYINAIIREILRIRPSSDNGVPHYTTTDITYKGVFIPKDTTISINQYALYYDPARFPNPDEFRPERFIEESEMIQKTSPNASQDTLPDRFVFGAGRRICPG
jgi:cytochrome P450